jgi:hypothetical protein
MAVDGSSRLGCLRFGVKDNLIFQFGFQPPKITMAHYIAALAALGLLPGHPRRRQLQDRFNTGPTQDVDAFIYDHARGLEQFHQGEQQLAVLGQIPSKTLAVLPVHNLV